MSLEKCTSLCSCYVLPDPQESWKFTFYWCRAAVHLETSEIMMAQVKDVLAVNVKLWHDNYDRVFEISFKQTQFALER